MDLYKQLLWPNRNICWPVIQKANDIKKKSDSQVDPVISQQDPWVSRVESLPSVLNQVLSHEMPAG